MIYKYLIIKALFFCMVNTTRMLFAFKRIQIFVPVVGQNRYRNNLEGLPLVNTKYLLL
jgi:hypothetical protein